MNPSQIFWVGLSLLFLACGSEGEDSSDKSSDTEATQKEEISDPPPTSVVTSREPGIAPRFDKPQSMCGQDGFNYLLSEYFYPQCNSCHGDGDLASGDETDAYTQMILVGDETLLRVVKAGQFCVGDCRLAEEDEIYQDLVTWQACK